MLYLADSWVDSFWLKNIIQIITILQIIRVKTPHVVDVEGLLQNVCFKKPSAAERWFPCSQSLFKQRIMEENEYTLPFV